MGKVVPGGLLPFLSGGGAPRRESAGRVSTPRAEQRAWGPRAAGEGWGELKRPGGHHGLGAGVS